MRNKNVLLTLLLLMTLCVGKSYAQFFGVYSRRNTVTDLGDLQVRICDTVVGSECADDFQNPMDAVNWSTGKCADALANLGYYIQLIQLNGQPVVYYNKQISCLPRFIEEGDCSTSYEWVFTVTDPQYVPSILGSGAPPLKIYQNVSSIKVGKNPSDAFENLGDTILCSPGVDIVEAWVSHQSFASNSSEDVANYVASRGGTVPVPGQDCWNDYMAGYVYNEVDSKSSRDKCYKVFKFEFYFANSECDGEYSYYQLVKMPAPALEVEGTAFMDTLRTDGCDETSVAPFQYIYQFEDYGIQFGDLMFRYMNLNGYTDYKKEYKDGKLYISRQYQVGDWCDSGNEVKLYQVIELTPYLNVTKAILKKDTYHTPGSLPPTINNIKELEKRGLRYESNCPNPSVEWVSDEEMGQTSLGDPITLRTYRIFLEGYEVEDFAYQEIRYIPDDPRPFEVRVDEALCDNGNKGVGQITDASVDEGCPSCLSNDQKWYRIEWENNSDSENTIVLEWEEGSDVDIWNTEELVPGNYTLKIYPTCPDYPDANDKAIFKQDFVVEHDKRYDEDKIIVKALNNAWSLASTITGDGSGNYSGENGDSQSWFYHTNTLLVWVHSVCGYDEDPEDEWQDIRTEDWYPAGGKKIGYKWQGDGVLKGYPEDKFSLIGMTEYEYDHTEFTQYYHWAPEFKERMGHLLFDGRSWEYSLSKGRNDMRVKVEYVEGGKKVTEKTDFTVYYQCISSAYDPNELHGPEGYDTVHFINATDPINYTIMFENDPEFATAAASRVKITCPLDDKGVVNSFRLGNFGFGDYTFDVPPMSSQYSQRIDLVDSLGVWLDVTAGVQIPENYAFWIFQSIDPATGLPPVGSIGFLPVNDTLNPGNGEGYVTFSINPRNTLNTGDEISEKAYIVFDQNDTVPTNTYTNRFDAISPSSALQCDTTNAASGLLAFAFTATDDQEGSGVDYVELYVNIDSTSYESLGRLSPDSVYQYQIGLGTQFQFIGCAVDHVNNKEDFKPTPEFTYTRGTAPTDIRLSASTFDEDAGLFTFIGDFSTTDDQTSNVFVYTLVDGEGSTHNDLFEIVGNALITNNDFRCYGLYDFTIRVRSLDLSNQYVEKVFDVHALQNMTPAITTVRDYICQNTPYYFGGEWINESGTYYDTLQTTHGCDSIVRLILDDARTPILTELVDEACFDDYNANGFEITADSLAQLTQGWTMDEDYLLSIDRYEQNFYGCYDTTRLALTIHPAFNNVDAVSVCATDLPYQYQGVSFYQDTVAVFSYQTGQSCDSVYTLHLSVKQQQDQSNDLVNGWNWFSTYVDQSNGEGLTNFENALNGNGQMIKSKTAFVAYDPDYNMWFGSLEEINNTSMFMVKMRDPQVTLLSGCPADIDTIMLAPGWSWIGYPLTDTTGVNQLTPAIGGLPTNNDVIKSKQSFAAYNAEYGIWYGSLDNMTPGVGYMYLSKANNVKPLYYGNRLRENDVQPLEIPVVHWSADDKPFANNMTIMGLISLDGQIINSDTLEVGAFVNNEQRGSGRAVYIEQMDAYRIFLTVHGEDGETVNFRLFDHSRDKERRIRGDKQLAFQADRHYGTLDEPYIFTFETYFDKYIQAEICQGEYYTDNNFRVFESGTYFKELTTAQGNDSIVRLDLIVNPVYHVEEEVVAVEFPFEYEGVVFDKPGTFVLPFQTAAACDSVWEVTVSPYEGLRELLISPQPALKTQRVSLYYPFTQAEQRGVVVEIYTVSGSLLQSKRPTRFPIELDPFPTAGTYMVKITMGTGEVLSGKIIIR